MAKPKKQFVDITIWREGDYIYSKDARVRFAKSSLWEPIIKIAKEGRGYQHSVMYRKKVA